MLFYDVDQIAEIAAGTRETWDIQPYAYLNLDPVFYESAAENQDARGGPNGIAYDSVNQKIYLSEYGGYRYGGEPWPLFHVFSLSDIGSTLDTTSSSPPANVSVNGSGVVSWDASTDDQGGDIIYVIFKWYDDICDKPALDEYRPIRTSLATTWTDPLYSAGDQYKVVAYDQSMNSSDDYEGTPTLPGDITGDDQVNIQDIQACVNHILGTQDWGAAADVNGDGSVNVLDVQAIVNIILSG